MAFPKSSFIGLDYQDASIATARKRPAERGVTGNIVFEVKAASEFGGHGFDLVCFLDCLLDLGDPVGALARCRKAHKPDSKVLLVKPYAGDRWIELLHTLNSALSHRFERRVIKFAGVVFPHALKRITPDLARQ